MTKRRNLVTAIGLATAVAIGAASGAQAGDKIARADLIAANCFNCHGFQGQSVGIIDSLTGISEQGIIKKMHEYRNGAKPSTIMERIAKGYTEAEIAAVAKYFGNLEANK